MSSLVIGEGPGAWQLALRLIESPPVEGRRVCLHCLSSFVPEAGHQQYCQERCRMDARNERKKQRRHAVKGKA